MAKIAIIGYFKSGAVADGGQGIKTAILTEEIEKIYGSEAVIRIDTDGWRKHPLTLVLKCVASVFKCENVLFLTDENGIRVFPKLLEAFNVFRHAKLHYYVVGGWLNEYLSQNPSYIKPLRKLDAIYVEIPSMKKALCEREFQNVVLVNKFRRLQPIDINDSIDDIDWPLKVCFFARVMQEKGIEEAIEAIKKANENTGSIKYTLDIFGAIDPEYKTKFDQIEKELPYYIKYKGVVDYHKSTSILSNYFAMLFPTYYKSEGYPNTFVDAYAAGLPIIATKWNYNAEIIQDYKDGILVDVGNIDQIIAALDYLSCDAQRYFSMKHCCLKRRDEYKPENAIYLVIKNLK